MLTSPGVTFDPAAAVAELTPFRAALARGDWPSARATLDRVEPALRTALIQDGGEVPGVEHLMWQVLGRDPDDTAAAAILATHMIKTGWAIRTDAAARYVSREQFAALHDWLRKAEQVLIEAAARNPQDCAVWVQRMTTARGLQLGQSESRRRYDRLASVDPHHRPGHNQMVQALCPKWGGTWEQAHAFARERMLAGPPGGQQGALVGDVLIEQWLALDSGEDRAFLLQPQIRDQLYEAAHHSVWHPEFRRSHGWVATMSTFAMLFSLVGDEVAAGGMFAALGNLASEHPWQYFGDPATEFRTRRDRALAAGARR